MKKYFLNRNNNLIEIELEDNPILFNNIKSNKEWKEVSKNEYDKLVEKRGIIIRL